VKAAFPTAKDIDRVMAFEPFQPITGETAAELVKRKSDGRAAVDGALRELRAYDMPIAKVPIGKVRRSAEKYASKLRSANAALVELGRLDSALPCHGLLDVQLQGEMLDQLRRETNDLLAAEWVWQRKRTKPAAKMTRLAAHRAFYLLTDLWNITPTAARGEAWPKLTKLLCEIANGPKRHDALRACKWMLARKVMEDAGIKNGVRHVRFVDPRKAARSDEDRAEFLDILTGKYWSTGE
jgi:hypothetical protein